MNNKEKIITVVALVITLAALTYAVTLVDNSDSKLIDNLIQGPSEELEGGETQIIEPLPGDEELVINNIEEGTGPGAKVGDTLLVHYRGTFEDGAQFDSSYDRGEPFRVTIGVSQVIRGWHLGLLGMKVGEKRQLIIPPHLGYGESNAGPIPPNATLYFDLELIENIGQASDQLIQVSP